MIAVRPSFVDVNQLRAGKMKRAINLVAAIALITSASVYADTYDPATNLLTIPTITVEGVTYTDVVVTVGQVISIGSSSIDPIENNSRNCNWSFNGNDFDSLTYEITVLPSTHKINVSITGMTNVSSFRVSSVALVQGSKSTEATKFPSAPGALWTGDDGFDGGTIPTGVIKTGTLTRFPSWFDLNQPFTWIDSGEDFTC